MFASLVAPLVALVFAGAQPVVAPSPTGYAESRAALSRACQGHDGWSDPAPPALLYGNTYYVGTCGITALLVTSPEGHVLIDGGPVEAAPLVAANITRLGFRLEDVRLILTTHEHIDHVGGIAALQRLTGAPVAARQAALAGLSSGLAQPDDPQAGSLSAFPPIRVTRTLEEGEVVSVGPTRITVHATPGHTAGSTSYTWQSCEGRACLNVAYVDSLSAVSADAYRFDAHPAYVATFRRTFARVAALPSCDLLLTPHPGASQMFTRFDGRTLQHPMNCAEYARAAGARLDARLAEEAQRPAESPPGTPRS